MHELVKPTAELLRLSGQMFSFGFEAIAEEQSRKQVADGAGSNTWLMGHVISCRYHTANMMGLKVELPWGDMFDKSIGDVDQGKMPSLEELKAAWEEISAKLETRLGELDEEFLMADAPFKFPTESQTNWAALAFMSMHESYHVGQMSFNRRVMGVETIFSIAMKKMKAAQERAKEAAAGGSNK